jgi:hypothetical protein
VNPTFGETFTWRIVQRIIYKISHSFEEAQIFGTASEPLVSYTNLYFCGRGGVVSLPEFIATLSLGFKDAGE